MTGMEFMSSAVSSFKDAPSFQSMLVAFSSPVIAFLASNFFTGIIQSSAATVAIVQSLALTGVIDYNIAIPLVLGANVGTCMTALLSSFGTSRDAKRVVALHFYSKLIGSIGYIIIIYFARLIVPEIFALPATMIGVAVIHTVFNISNTIVLTPFKKYMLRLCEITVKSKDEKTHTIFLDERLFNNTPLAISECRRLSNEMAELAKDSILKSIRIINNFDAETAKQIMKQENLTDKYEDRLGTYLVRLSSNKLEETSSHSIARMLHSIGDFERIGDHALNLCRLAEEMHTKKISFSAKAKKELDVITGAITEIIDMTVSSFINDDVALASRVEPLEQVIDKLKSKLKAMHVSRLQNGECTIELGFIFTDIIANFERISDHCSNIAVYTMQISDDRLDTHKYLKGIKNSAAGNFMDEYNMFEKKYSLN
jgi:phosphate:Na+ symporter